MHKTYNGLQKLCYDAFLQAYLLQGIRYKPHLSVLPASIHCVRSLGMDLDVSRWWRGVVEFQSVQKVDEVAEVDGVVVCPRRLDKEFNLLILQNTPSCCFESLQAKPRLLHVQLAAPIGVKFPELLHDLLGAKMVNKIISMNYN